MRIAFVLPGLNRVARGAEVAFESIANELAQRKDVEVTLFGTGKLRREDRYEFISIKSKSREYFDKWPFIPIFRNEYIYEEFTYLMNLFHHYKPQEFDITVTCSYPFMNWYLRLKGGRERPAHVFVTQNGDHPISTNKSEYCFFGCDGLVCTNPEYFEKHKHKWFSTLIPNGVNPKLFYPGKANRQALGLPDDVPIVLMVSALIEEKRVANGIEAIAEVPDVHLVVCGDGPERQKILELGNKVMAGRFHWKKLPRFQMPEIYRTADLFLHMSLTEPSANAYIEALATGLPIVTHDRMVTRWTLEDTAILVNTNSKEEIIEGVKNAITKKSIECVIARQSLVNQRFVWSKLSEEYYQFFSDVLKKDRQKSYL